MKQTPPTRFAMRMLLTFLLTVVGWGCCADRASAVLVFLKGIETPLRGFLISETEYAIELNQLMDDGRQQRRIIARSEIEDLLVTVSNERLAALSVDRPGAYRDYAEELAEKRKDPEAQITGIRLYLIAAYLDPDRLGRSALLGAIPLSRSATESRRFRAMAYLLDPKHDVRLLQSSAGRPATTPAKTALNRRQIDFVLQSLRELRQGHQREAKAHVQRVQMRNYLPALTDQISYDELLEACQSVCPHCRRGRVDCPQCAGRKMILAGGLQRVACPTCGARGEVECPQCRGDFRSNPLSPSLLRRIVQVELQWMPAGGAPPAVRASSYKQQGWNAAALAVSARAAAPLTLGTLTEFDPRACLYRDGQWVAPNSASAEAASQPEAAQ